MMKTLLVDVESLSPLSKLYLFKLTHWNESSEVDAQIRELEAKEPLDDAAKEVMQQLQLLEASEPVAPEKPELPRGCCCRVFCSVCPKHDSKKIEFRTNEWMNG